MHRLLVVGVALLHAEHTLQVVGLVYRVTHPTHVADVELLALGELNVDTYAVVAQTIYRVREDGRITIASRVIEVEKQILILLILVSLELRALEDVPALLACLLEGLTQSLVVKLLVALEGNLTHLDLLVLGNLEGNIHCILYQGVVLDDGLNLGVTEALIGKILLYESLAAVDDIIRELRASLQLELIQQILLLAATYALAHDKPLIDTWSLLKEELQIERVALDRGSNLHIREVTLTPQTRDRVRDVGTWQIDRVARDESRRCTQLVVVEVLYAVHVDVTYVVESRLAPELHHRCILVEGERVGSRLWLLLLAICLSHSSRCRHGQQSYHSYHSLKNVSHLSYLIFKILFHQSVATLPRSIRLQRPLQLLPIEVGPQHIREVELGV